MSKFRSPFSTNELFITQTYHTGSGNTAIDLSATAETPVYAIADGKVTYRSSAGGSYCIQQIDNSDLRVYYVHTYKWVGANTYVKKGQIIAYIAPTNYNGGYPTHLHLGLQAGKNIMDYFDRSLFFNTRYQAIKDVWFKGDSLNWSLFKDLSYEKITMKYKVGDVIEITGEQNMRKGSGTTYSVTGVTKPGDIYTIEDGPRVANDYTWYDLKGADWIADVGKFQLYVKPTNPPEPPGQTECEKQVDILKQQIRALESTTGTQEEETEALTTELAETKAFLGEMDESYNILKEDYKRLELEKLDLQEQLSIGSLAKASTGEIFTELWKRVTRSIK
jgi:hypothetical protein